MIAYERLAYLEKLLIEARKLPLSEKVAVDKVEVIEIIKEIKVALPEELKQAKWISEERKKIIIKAHLEADEILKEAKEKVNKHEITLMAEEYSKKLINTAENESKQIKAGSREYADKLLLEIQEKLQDISEIINTSRKELI